MPPKKPWVWCRETGCDTKLIFATRDAGTGTARLVPYEYADQDPDSTAAASCHVIVNGVAFTPAEAIEHFMTRGTGRSEEAARALAHGFPFHLPHAHARPEEQTP